MTTNSWLPFRFCTGVMKIRKVFSVWKYFLKVLSPNKRRNESSKTGVSYAKMLWERNWNLYHNLFSLKIVDKNSWEVLRWTTEKFFNYFPVNCKFFLDHMRTLNFISVDFSFCSKSLRYTTVLISIKLLWRNYLIIFFSHLRWPFNKIIDVEKLFGMKSYFNIHNFCNFFVYNFDSCLNFDLESFNWKRC